MAYSIHKISENIYLIVIYIINVMNLLTRMLPSRRKRSALIRYDSVECYDSPEPSKKSSFWQNYCGRTTLTNDSSQNNRNKYHSITIILLTTLICILFLLISAINFRRSTKDIAQINSIRLDVESLFGHVEKIQALLHELTASIKFINSNYSIDIYNSEVLIKRSNTDHIFDEKHGHEEHESDHERDEIIHHEIEDHRNLTDLELTSIVTEVKFYSKTVYELSAHKVELLQSTSTLIGWQNVAAIHFLILAEDEATFCRAIGNLYFLRGYLYPTELLLFTQHSSRHQLYLTAAEKYSSFIRNYLQFQFNDTLKDIVNQEIIKVMSNRHHPPTTELLSRWNVLISLYLQTLTTLSYQLRDQINNDTTISVRNIKIINNQQILILISALIVGILVIIMTSGMQREIHRQVSRFREQLGDIEYQRSRTDQLLHQLLPCTVAEQLKLGKAVIAESFDDVTVYISDIVGFTVICHTTKPVQVVYMLNAIYTLFDRIVDRYQVYKTETIGDAYMVASGVPQRLSDRKHTTEIAKMAMEILTSMERIKIPHAPVDQLRMRIGIHTGQKIFSSFTAFIDMNYLQNLHSKRRGYRITL